MPNLPGMVALILSLVINTFIQWRSVKLCPSGKLHLQGNYL